MEYWKCVLPILIWLLFQNVCPYFNVFSFDFRASSWILGTGKDFFHDMDLNLLWCLFCIEFLFIFQRFHQRVFHIFLVCWAIFIFIFQNDWSIALTLAQQKSRPKLCPFCMYHLIVLWFYNLNFSYCLLRTGASAIQEKW